MPSSSSAPLTEERARTIILEEVTKIFEGFWEKSMVPWMKETFATKEELHEAFETYDFRMEKRFTRLQDSITDLDVRMGEVEKHVLKLRKDVWELRKDTKLRFDIHADNLREVRKAAGVSEKGFTYKTKGPTRP